MPDVTDDPLAGLFGEVVVAPGGRRLASTIEIVAEGEIARASRPPLQRDRDTGVNDFSVKFGDTATSNWITSASWLDTTGHGIASFTATFAVPDDPINDSGRQTIFYFIGMQDSPVWQILQPVLQFGGSVGRNWTIYSWLVPKQGKAKRSLGMMTVAAGTPLTARITAARQNGTDGFLAEFVGHPETRLFTDARLRMPVIALEAYDVEGASDFPGDRTSFGGIGVAAPAGPSPLAWTIENRVQTWGARTDVPPATAPHVVTIHPT